MPSLSSLFASYGTLLVVDAASRRFQVGLLRVTAPPLWRSSEEEAGTSLFQETDALFQTAQLTLTHIGALIFCEGPGSMLGIRTTAMALRTWQTLHPLPVYAYTSLVLAAHLARAHRPDPEFGIIADARRESWHCLRVGPTEISGPVARVTTADLPLIPLLTPENFRAWSQSPRPLLPCSYDLALIFSTLADCDYFRPVEAPDAFQHTVPEYKKWSAQIHQAVSTTP